MAAVARILTASFAGTIHPSLFYFDMAFVSIAILLLGGRSSIIGVVVGVVVITSGTELMRCGSRNMPRGERWSDPPGASPPVSKSLDPTKFYPLAGPVCL